MAHRSALRLLVLHGLRVKGFAEPADVANLWALDEAEVAVELKALADEGLVRHREGRLSGWSLSPEGRDEHAVLMADELDDGHRRPAVAEAYARFGEINPELLATCTAWQLKPTEDGQVVNDHLDADYDSGIVDRLAALHERAIPTLGGLSGTVERFGHYPVRLANALARVQAGDTEWFTRPLVDSYHTVWFELHEDLLSTLGLRRGTEAQP